MVQYFKTFHPSHIPQTSLYFNSPFSPFALLSLYIYLPVTLHTIPCQIHKPKTMHLPLIFRALTLLFHLILPHMSWLQPRKGDLHFISSDNNNYYFDVKVERCGFMGFINDVIDCGCLGFVFCFRIKEKEKDNFYINFYSIIFLQSFFFFFLISCHFNGIIIMNMCV